jgi:hypothetical protein
MTTIVKSLPSLSRLRLPPLPKGDKGEFFCSFPSLMSVAAPPFNKRGLGGIFPLASLDSSFIISSRFHPISAIRNMSSTPIGDPKSEHSSRASRIRAIRVPTLFLLLFCSLSPFALLLSPYSSASIGVHRRLISSFFTLLIQNLKSKIALLLSPALPPLTPSVPSGSSPSLVPWQNQTKLILKDSCQNAFSSEMRKDVSLRHMRHVFFKRPRQAVNWPTPEPIANSLLPISLSSFVLLLSPRLLSSMRCVMLRHVASYPRTPRGYKEKQENTRWFASSFLIQNRSIREIRLAPCAIRDIRVPKLFFFGWLRLLPRCTLGELSGWCAVEKLVAF